jgi:hypothetical protein
VPLNRQREVLQETRDERRHIHALLTDTVLTRGILARRLARLEQLADQAVVPGILSAQDAAGPEVSVHEGPRSPAHRRDALDKLRDGVFMFLGLRGHGRCRSLGRRVRHGEDKGRVPVRGSLRGRTQNREGRARKGPSDHCMYLRAGEVHRRRENQRRGQVGVPTRQM